MDPRLASDPAAARRDPALVESELRQLVDDAHALDLYVIFDVVLNHTGDLFDYEGLGAEAPWRDDPYPIRWRDAEGLPRPEWAQAPLDAPRDAAVWPAKLRPNEYFRRRGNALLRPGELGEAAGDFFSLKEHGSSSATRTSSATASAFASGRRRAGRPRPGPGRKGGRPRGRSGEHPPDVRDRAQERAERRAAHLSNLDFGRRLDRDLAELPLTLDAARLLASAVAAPVSSLAARTVIPPAPSSTAAILTPSEHAARASP